jgi:hypothetical protein
VLKIKNRGYFMSASPQPSTNASHPINLTVHIEQTPGIFSKIVHNVKDFSREEKILVVAFSVLMTAAVLVTLPQIYTGVKLLHQVGVITFAPPFFMYYLSDFLKAAKEFSRDLHRSPQLF